MSDLRAEAAEVREGQRISKIMARAGLCSRRDAEAWIEAGRVSVNGKVLATPAFNVGPDDDVTVDGERLRAPERTRLFFFHKPRGLVTSARDPEGRATIFDALPKDLPRVVSVGRLDINTEGLLLLTNDGGLARVLELPATGWLRRYRVRAYGEINQSQLDSLREGVTFEGMHYAGIEARLERQQGSNVWIMMGLREGKNREIKRVLEYLGLSVNRLIRVSFGPFELGDLPEGAVAELNTRILRDQLGLKLAKKAGANFDAPIASPRGKLTQSPPREVRRLNSDRDDRMRPPSRGQRDRAEIARELAARGERPETKVPRQRKHISELRADARANVEGPRKRIERDATCDRKGREIKIERMMAARTPRSESNHPRDDRLEHRGKNRPASEAEFGANVHLARSRQDRPPSSRPYSQLDRVAKPSRHGSGPREGRERGRQAAPSEAVSGKSAPLRSRWDENASGKSRSSRAGSPRHGGRPQDKSPGRPPSRRT